MRKLHQANWEHNEILVLIKSRRNEHLVNLDMVDVQVQFKIVVTKWKWILVPIMNACFSTHLCNDPTCKDKWGVIAFDQFKKIYDYNVRI